ncbi:DUF2993 domain-containing protein [Streptomyces sp. NPDC003077]|uniref:LmeA family phospholipid-binding protein n=1 Tax=Streptomyces sp. NPDC003077 TaxID=3154443 RepID=UPI0033A442EE
MNRSARRILITLAVLAAVAVGADVGARWLAEGMAADKIASRIVYGAVLTNDTKKAEVDIRGFPFLTQVAGGHIGEVGVRLTDIVNPYGVGNSYLTLDAIDFTAYGVTLEGTSRAVAERVEGTAAVDYPTLSKVLGAQTHTDPATGRVSTDPVTVAPAPGGRGDRVRITQGNATVEAKMSGRDGELVFSPVDGKGIGEVAIKVPTGGVPVQVAGASADADHLKIHFAGRGVRLVGAPD